jgi:putative transposase
MHTRIYYERNLPHYQPARATYLVNIRLAGSLPRDTYEEIEREYRRFREKLQGKNLSPAAVSEYRERQYQYFLDIDRLLDAARDGPCWLSNHSVAHIVADAIRDQDGKRYSLLAYCIMPNHVHIVMTLLDKRTEVRSTRYSAPGSDFPLTRIMRQLKGRSAREANLILHRAGAFWQHESYDHVIRSAEELERILWYIVINPVAAGLARTWDDWKWTYCREGLL